MFQYVDDSGERHSIDSSDVNDYLREISGREITAKDFRTWAGTNLAIVAFCALKEEKPTKKSELEVVKSVAQRLGNTVAVCRKCYIHPAVISGYHGGSLQKSVANVSQQIAGSWLAVESVRRFLTYSRKFIFDDSKSGIPERAIFSAESTPAHRSQIDFSEHY